MENNRSGKKVVIAVGGPPHSGKSIFLGQLSNILPTRKKVSY